MITQEKSFTKTALAKKLGVSRASLYYKHKQPGIDEEVRRQIESVLADHHSYGHKRLALSLKLNKKRILRVMKKFNIKPYRQRKNPAKPGDRGQPPVKYPNVSLVMCAIVIDYIWVSDFTYIRYRSCFIYLATIMDQYSREVVGWNISRYHNAELVLGAFEHALGNPDHALPEYLHSDQGSEYQSQAYTQTVTSLSVQISMSGKSSPWHNGYQESFYSQFKVDLGDPNRFEDLGELIEAINQTVYYYNTQRIHTSLKMIPQQFRQISRRRINSDNTPSELGT